MKIRNLFLFSVVFILIISTCVLPKQISASLITNPKVDGKLLFDYTKFCEKMCNTEVMPDESILLIDQDGYAQKGSLSKFKNGKKQWVLEFNGIPQLKLVTDQFIYVSTPGSSYSDGYLHAISMNGKIKWKFNTKSKSVHDEIILKHNKLYLNLVKSGENWDLAIIDLNGKEIMRKTSSYLNSFNVDSQGYIYLNDTNHLLSVFYPNGELFWNIPMDIVPGQSIVFSPDEEIIYTHGIEKINGDLKEFIYSYNKTGQLIWKYEMTNNGTIHSLTPIGNDSILVQYDHNYDFDKDYNYLTDNNLLLLGSSGKKIWRKVFPNSEELGYKKLLIDERFDVIYFVNPVAHSKYSGLFDLYALKSDGTQLYRIEHSKYVPTQSIFNKGKVYGKKFDRIEPHLPNLIYPQDKLFEISLPNLNKQLGIYIDVPVNYWAAKEIKYLSDKKIIAGYKDGSFKPNNNVTRAQAAVMLARALKLNLENRPDPGFEDVREDHWAFKAIAAIVDEEIFIKEEKFNPKWAVRRAEMAYMLVNAHDLKGEYGRDFLDVPKDHWAYEPIQVLAGNKVTTGKGDGNFDPKGVVSRAHFSVFMTRILDENY